MQAVVESGRGVNVLTGREDLEDKADSAVTYATQFAGTDEVPRIPFSCATCFQSILMLSDRKAARSRWTSSRA